ncbi:interleukin-like EMT inducer domain-containing protein [Microcoleus sp. N9_B4]|uniref:interleukin-like EMT inducer domain-containing protein n=1 Tax=Microcoleus sp. N9_B4 TaxID=3055386 RepID=UPI002FD71D6B
MDKLSIEVLSKGYLFGNSASIKVNGQDIGDGDYGRGLNVAVLNETTGEKLWFRHFDTHVSEQDSTAFAEAIEALPISCIVTIAVADEAACYLTERAKRACQTIGSSQIYNLGDRNSWAIIGQKGAAPGISREELSSTSAVTLEHQITLQSTNDNGFEIEARSAGFHVGNSASILVNGVEILINGGYQRGMNVIVFDENTGAILDSRSFDTHVGDSLSDAFAQFIESLPLGRIVAIAVADEAVCHLTERGKIACESIGSSLIRQLGDRGSWAIVGRKGNSKGNAAESLSNTGKAHCSNWLIPLTQQENGFSISTRSAGGNFGKDAEIFVDDLPVFDSAATQRGLNVVVIDPDTGTVTDKKSFDVYGNIDAAQAFAQFIENVSVGSIVAIAVKDEASSNLTDAARRACQSLGSSLIHNLGYRDSFTLIGRKGAAPGSVPEILRSDGCAALSFRFPLSQETLKPFHTITVLSAGCAVGNSAQIAIDGIPVNMPNGYQRGLNVVMLEPTGHVQRACNFDTYLNTAQSEKFAQLIEDASDGQLVIIAVMDEATGQLTERAKAACESIGSSLIRQLEYRGSWAIVGKKGAIPGIVSESMSNSATAICHDWINPTSEAMFGSYLVAKSAGCNSGNMAAIFENGTVVPIEGGYRRGLNVIIFNELNGALLSAQNYDTYASSEAADTFAQFIESLPLGRVVAIAVMGEATAHLTERARRACASIGGSQIYNLGYQWSWSIIGYKGAASGSVMESLNDAGAVSSKMWMPYFTTDENYAQKRNPLFAFFAVVAVIIATVPLIFLQPKSKKKTVTVYVWAYDYFNMAWGHASLKLDEDTYISWWPSEQTNRKLPVKFKNMALLGELYSAPPILPRRFEDDVKSENGRQPKYTIALNAVGINNNVRIDTQKIKEWWNELSNDPNSRWITLSQNCSTTVVQALYQGGAFSLLTPREYDNFTNVIVWSPSHVVALANELARHN